MIKRYWIVAAFVAASGAAAAAPRAEQRPNIVIIYTDDLGYGDVSAYGATALKTPNIDSLAAHGLRFTDAHAAAATCTPSRYALMTGEYAWRRPGTGVLPGNAALIIEPGRKTLPSMLQQAGYATGIVGKWHLGLGPAGGPDWNGVIAPGPNDVGFGYAFIMPATADRVPTVYVENRRVVGLDPADPIKVDYDTPIGDWPTGRTRPDLLKMPASHGHDQTIVNGIGRIGYMTGGRAALWKDEDMALTFTARATAFIEQHKDAPFFLYFAPHDPHVPRVPNPRFAGRTGMGPRGDAIVQADWSVGEILRALDRFHLADTTIVVFTSDNGPVIDDGYRDASVEKLGSHRPAGPFRGGKYSNFEAGTRVPLIVRWPRGVKRGVSGALVSHIDLLASLARFTQQPLAAGEGPDSQDVWSAFTGASKTGRADYVEQGSGLSLRRGTWKYIEASDRRRINPDTNTELGNDTAPQLYDLASDPGERNNVAATFPARLAEMQQRLEAIRVTAAPGAPAQTSGFQPALLDRPDVKKAIQSVDDRGSAIVDEWIRLVEIPAPSKKEQARAEYIKSEMEKLGLADVRVDDMSNVSGVRKGSGGGPTVVFAAHMDTVFPEGTDLTVKRDGDILRAPGVGDDTSNLMAVLEMFRALDRGGVKTKGDLVFLASVQEELGLLGAKHWLETSAVRPDMFVAVDVSSNQVWYGALRITQYKFFYTSPGAHTLESRGGPNPAKAVAKAIDAVYEIKLPPIAAGLDTFKLPVANVGMINGGTVVNAVPREAWFSVDLRSLDTATQTELEQAVENVARDAASREGVGFRMDKTALGDYSKARPAAERLNSPLVQTALGVKNHFRKPGTPVIVPADVGSTDANNAIAMGIPAVAIGAVLEHTPHRLEEYAEAGSIVPGVKSLIALAVALTTR